MLSTFGFRLTVTGGEVQNIEIQIQAHEYKHTNTEIDKYRNAQIQNSQIPCEERGKAVLAVVPTTFGSPLTGGRGEGRNGSFGTKLENV